MESVQLTFEQLALIALLSVGCGALLLHLFRERREHRQSSREAEQFKLSAIEAEQRARKDRAEVDDWIQKR